jgi:hypothetical protein
LLKCRALKGQRSSQRPFSVYRAGFEVRTYRRVQRLLFFNNFPAETSIGVYGLVHSVNLTYSDQLTPPDSQAPIYTFLTSLTQTGYHTEAQGQHNRSLPPLEFDYSQPRLDPTIHTADRDSLRDLPEGVDGSRFAQELEARGVRTPAGRHHWDAKQVSRLLAA